MEITAPTSQEVRQSMLAAIDKLQNPQDRARKLTEIVDQFPPPEQPALLRRAYEEALEISNSPEMEINTLMQVHYKVKQYETQPPAA